MGHCGDETASCTSASTSRNYQGSGILEVIVRRVIIADINVTG